MTRYLLFTTIVFQTLLMLLVTVVAQPCSRGSFLSQSGCQQCPPGSFSDSTNSLVCKPCPAGTFFDLAGGQTAKACRKCPEGTFSRIGSASCTPCPAETNSTSGEAGCRYCPPGTFIIGHDQPCQSCSVGRYQDLSSQLTCKQCSFSNSASQLGASSVNQCQVCPPGTEVSDDGICIACPPGTFRSETSSAGCVPCPLGSTSKIQGAKSCTPCRPGEFGVQSYSPSSSFCQACPDGSTTFGEGQTSCRVNGESCSFDTIETSLGDCARCEPDQFYSAEQGRCVPCPEGFGSASGFENVCRPCAEIESASISESSCFQSSGGFLPSAINPCPAGYFINGEVFGLCNKCEPGTFSAIENANKCEACPPGTVQPNSAQNSCIPCPSGTIAISSVLCVVPQTHCGPNQTLTKNEFGQDSCLQADCVDPPLQFEYNTVRPSQCFCFGSGISMGDNKCEKCAINEISLNAWTCEKCPGDLVRISDFEVECGCTGPYSENIGFVDGICRQCPPGSYGKINLSPLPNDCVKCPAGTYRKVKDLKEFDECGLTKQCQLEPPCIKCSPGFFTDTEGSTECKPCPHNTVANGMRQTQCVPPNISVDYPEAILPPVPSTEPNVDPLTVVDSSHARTF